MGCLGSWEPFWGSLWLGWPPMKLTEMGEFPHPHPEVTVPWSDPPHFLPVLYTTNQSSVYLHSFIHIVTKSQ